MAQKLKTLAVYCGHQYGTAPQFARDAKKIGELLGKINLIWYSVAVMSG